MALDVCVQRESGCVLHRDNNAYDDCRAISHFIAKHEGVGQRRYEIRRTLARDLLWRARTLDGITKAAILPGVYGLMPNELLKQFKSDSESIRQVPGAVDELLPIRRDVAIVTVLPIEHEAVASVFNVSPDETSEIGWLRYWDTEIERVAKRALRTIVTSVGTARNVPTALHVSKLLRRVEADLVIMVGIAAGPSDKVELVDVVAGIGVYDYEHVRSELRRGRIEELPRPFVAYADEDMKRDIDGLIQHHSESARDLYVAYARRYASIGRTDYQVQRRMKIHDGVIAAGERLLADGSLRRMRKKFEERIRAGDQEDSGFVQACMSEGARWAIFRGISDLGDPTKSDKEHLQASLAAAATAITFLTQAFTAHDDPVSW